MRLVTSVIDAFWSLVDIRDTNKCWLWRGGANGDGYGYFKKQRVHRLAYTISRGKQPRHLVCHTCNTRLCCNPNHLYDGTHQDNMRDMAAAGSHDGKNRRGDKHPNSKLSNAQARIIKRSRLPGVVLSRLFRVSPATISMIRHGTRRQKS